MWLWLCAVTTLMFSFGVLILICCSETWAWLEPITPLASAMAAISTPWMLSLIEEED